MEVKFTQQIADLQDVVPAAATPTGRCSVSFVRMSSVSSVERWNRYLPERMVHCELLYKVEVEYSSRTWNFCPFSLVDTDAALMRGWLLGFPKRIGLIELVLPPRAFGQAPAGAEPFFEQASAMAATAGSAALRARLTNLRQLGEPSVGRPFLLQRRIDGVGGQVSSGTLVTPVVSAYAKRNEVVADAELLVPPNAEVSDFPTIVPLRVTGGSYFQDYVEISGVEVVK